MSNREDVSRRRFLELAGACVTAAVAEETVANDASGERGKTTRVLRIRNNRRLEVLDPAFTFNQIEIALDYALLPMLVEARSGGQGWAPLDASVVELLDDTHLRFVLKDNLYWSNGYGRVTAHDVKSSFERVANPRNNSLYTDDWSTLLRVEVRNELEGVLVLSEPFSPLLTTSLAGPAGAILPAAALRGRESRNFGLELPAVAGPYRISSMDPGRQVTLERNPLWRGRKPMHERIELVLVVDDKAAELAYDAGEVDATRLSASSLQHYRSRNMQGSVIQSHPLHAYTWLGMRVDHPLFRDIRVRRAIQQAVNVPEVVEGTYFGAVRPATGPIAPGVLGHRTKSALPKFDPGAAKRLLAEAGYPRGFRTVITTINEAEITAAATIVATQLREIGIRAEVAPEDNNSVWVRAQGPLKYRSDDQMILWQFGVSADPHWYTVWFTPGQIGKWNWERWNSAEFGELARQGTRTTDPATRHAIYVRMANLMDASGAYVFLANGESAVIHRSDVAYKVRQNPLQPAFREM